ncbi:hypothetical protein LEMLEM_LOCUS15494 [Lemmus lemmus]
MEGTVHSGARTTKSAFFASWGFSLAIYRRV